MEQMLALFLPSFSQAFPVFAGILSVCIGLGNRREVLMIREPLASRNRLMLLTSAELGHHGVVRSQEVSLALFTVRWVSGFLVDVLFFFQTWSVVDFRNISPRLPALLTACWVLWVFKEKEMRKVKF